MTNTDPIQVNPSVIFREIGDQTLLVPVGQSVDEVRSIYTLNETAAFVYKQLQQNVSRDQLMATINEHFEVEEGNELTTWVEELLNEFREHNILL